MNLWLLLGVLLIVFVVYKDTKPVVDCKGSNVMWMGPPGKKPSEMPTRWAYKR